MDRTIGDRDPTMDARIVHCVGVSNKKEQSTYQHKERSLKSAKDVQEHIHRREEKELIRQLNKLQDEKGRRHPDILGSRSRSRTNSRVTGSRPNSNLDLILHADHNGNRTTGEAVTGGASTHDAAVGSANAAPMPPSLAAGPSHHKASLNNRHSINGMRRGSVVIGGTSSHLMHHPHQKQPVFGDIGHGHHGIGHGHHGFKVGAGLGAGGSKHTNLGISPQLSRFSQESAAGPPIIHQPAGYGHTIKEHVKREGLNKKRPAHSYMDPKESHHRPSVGNSMWDTVRGSKTTMARSGESDVLGSSGSRFLLHSTAGHQPLESRPSRYLASSGQSLHRAGESMHRAGTSSQPRVAVPSRYVTSRIFGGQSVPSGIAEEDQKSSRDQGAAHHSASDESGSSTDSKPETVLKLGFADDEQHQHDQGSTTKVHFEDKIEDGTSSNVTHNSPEKGHRGKSDHIVSAGKSSPRKMKEDRHKFQRKHHPADEKPSRKPAPPKSKKPSSKSSPVVKLSSDVHSHPSKEARDPTTRGPGSRAKLKAAPSSRIHIPLETLQDLQTTLGNSLHLDHTSANVEELLTCLGGVDPQSGSSYAYDPSNNAKCNRNVRAKLRALQMVNSQIEALRHKEQSNAISHFDPLEILRCRYLRLSKSNVESLTEMCREAGIEVDMHPHMDIEDLSKYVFSGSKPESEHPAHNLDVKHVIL